MNTTHNFRKTEKQNHMKKLFGVLPLVVLSILPAYSQIQNLPLRSGDKKSLEDILSVSMQLESPMEYHADQYVISDIEQEIRCQELSAEPDPIDTTGVSMHLFGNLMGSIRYDASEFVNDEMLHESLTGSGSGITISEAEELTSLECNVQIDRYLQNLVDLQEKRTAMQSEAIALSK